MMANEQDKDPTTRQESDISKAQAAQQPISGQRQRPELGEERSDKQPEKSLQGETATRQRTDVEGASQPSEKGEAASGFVGSQGQQDNSSELIDEEEEDFAKGGQGAPEGK